MGTKLAGINTSYFGYFGTTDGVSAPFVAPDALPVGIGSRNGADDAAIVITIAAVTSGGNPVAGRYYYTLTVPAGYSVGDKIGVFITWTVNSLPGAYIDSFQVTSGSDMPTVTGGAVPATSASVQSAMTSQGFTSARAAALDTTGSNAATAATQSTSAAATSTAIKAKTDLLPASPASTSDVQPTIVLPGS